VIKKQFPNPFSFFLSKFPSSFALPHGSLAAHVLIFFFHRTLCSTTLPASLLLLVRAAGVQFSQAPSRAIGCCCCVLSLPTSRLRRTWPSTSCSIAGSPLPRPNLLRSRRPTRSLGASERQRKPVPAPSR
jgi:hypothetical protein